MRVERCVGLAHLLTAPPAPPAVTYCGMHYYNSKLVPGVLASGLSNNGTQRTPPMRRAAGNGR